VNFEQEGYTMKFAAKLFSLVVLILLVIMVADRFRTPDKTTIVTRSTATRVLDRMQEWGKWMAGLQAGTLAAVATLTEKKRWINQRSRGAAAATLMFVGLALVGNSTLLSGLASVEDRLDNCFPQAAVSPNAASGSWSTASPSVERASNCLDIFEKDVFSYTPVRVGLLAMLQHWLWFIGVLCLSYLIYESRVKPMGPSRQLQ
jgi:hypothetical protein